MKNTLEKSTTESILAHQGYKLGATIGEGTFAKIRIGVCKLTNQKVAVKMLSKHNCDLNNKDDKIYQRIKREVSVVKGLKHPNIVKYITAIETTTRMCIVMEYMKNGSLFHLLTNEGYLSESVARKWFKQILDALSYMHRRGIAHRDIKCENVLLDDTKKNVKLIDFGLAMNQLHSSGEQIRNCFSFCGTLPYASIELLYNTPHPPDMSDLWASAVVLYAMLFRYLPFGDDDLQIEDIEEGVKFPSKPKVSKGCKELLRQIFVPVENRMTLDEVKANRWVQNFNAKE